MKFRVKFRVRQTLSTFLAAALSSNRDRAFPLTHPLHAHGENLAVFHGERFGGGGGGVRCWRRGLIRVGPPARTRRVNAARSLRAMSWICFIIVVFVISTGEVAGRSREKRPAPENCTMIACAAWPSPGRQRSAARVHPTTGLWLVQYQAARLTL